ncbi:protein SENESCENCE-ASSOCIATED GENE 21, mitochondrial-like isoform X2 [Humulus lupulus]|uniref:protein SENESCENCE-ASSOCIATED GENE 21, mitochondrial-like isoform X2 n=1 Tax=Humulus lupulus TaxID=3486 RepID=UPI002B416BDF|nr:protein SENESCENCE-ASSOCIATED GENE 21, mitochondrial-like isoform X2 [Humulus lupulus]
MARVQLNSFILLRRCYAVVAENIGRGPVAVATAAAMRKAAVLVEPSNRSVVDANKKEIFWMRDPNTGNWIPESHFGDIDAAELREKLLPKKNNRL